MKTKRGSLIGLLSFAFVLLASGVAMATIIYEFYGTIQVAENVGTKAFTGINVGDSFTYGLIVNETVADSNSNDVFGHYDAIMAMYLNIKGQRYLAANAGQIVIANNDLYSSGVYMDIFQPYIYSSAFFTLNNLGEAVLSSQLNLWQKGSNSSETTVFSSDGLPLFAPDPAVFNYLSGFNVYLIAYINHGGGWIEAVYPYLQGEITGSFFSATVPEPSTMILLGSALLGLWGARKKFKK
jgi:hypothetical protein